MGQSSQRAEAGDDTGTPLRALRASVATAVASSVVVVLVESGRRPHGIHARDVGLAVLLLVGAWVIERVRVPAGLDRAGRVAYITGVNAVLLPAAVLLPPALFLPLAFARALAFVRSRGWLCAVVNGCLGATDMCAAAVVFCLLAPSRSTPDVDLASVLALIAAGTALLVAESVAFAVCARALKGLDPADMPLLAPAELLRDSPDVLLGALICLATAAPPALLLVVPLIAWRVQWIRDYGSVLNAFRDPKTGLLTHSAFVDLAGGELARARRSGRPLSILVVDTDGLSRVNNTHGHLAGDLYIAAIAQLLTRICRGEDLVSRFGGDEFCVLLPDNDVSVAGGLAERIRAEAERTQVPGLDRCLSVSIGVTDDVADDTVYSLLRRADAALLQAKRCGRNRVVVDAGSHTPP